MTENSGEKKETLLNQFDQSLQKDIKKHTPQSNSWFDTVKKFFQ